ncbi:MAG: hypothetical protein GY898_12430 [Proteobacteria bacterium]|nr:hypothetical protein [Pseudomonadota bacterium]
MTSKRLERLVRLKKLVERQKAADLVAEERRLSDATAQAEATQAEIDAVDEGTGTQDVSAEDMLAANRWRGHLARKLQKDQGAVVEQAAQVSNVRTDVQEAWRERRLMEGMKDRAVTAEAEEAAVGERKEYEAIALSVYSRRSKTEER